MLVVLAHRDDAIATRVVHEVRVPQRSLTGDGARCATGVEPVETAVGDVAVPHDSVAHGHRAAAVFVHPRAHVVGCAGDVGDVAGRVAANEHVAPLVGGAQLHPVEVVAVDGGAADADALLGEHVGADGGAPGAAGRRGGGHGPP